VTGVSPNGHERNGAPEPSPSTDANDAARPAEPTSSGKPLWNVALVVAGIIAVGAFAWHIFSPSRDDSSTRNAMVGGAVKTSMQRQFDTDARFAPYHLQVEKVDVVKQTGNQYEGLALIRSAKGIDHNVEVQVTVDGENVLWKTAPGSFAFMVLEQPNAPTPTSAPSPTTVAPPR
jgi:hypothetical protein